MHYLMTAILLLAITAPATAGDDEQRIKTCKSLKQAMERYTDQRRRGGSASQMDAWKRARLAKKADWDRLRCRDLGYHLK
jgi:hypothetical protein